MRAFIVDTMAMKSVIVNLATIVLRPKKATHARLDSFVHTKLRFLKYDAENAARALLKWNVTNSGISFW